jgi:hypothetical protein
MRSKDQIVLESIYQKICEDLLNKSTEEIFQDVQNGIKIDKEKYDELKKEDPYAALKYLHQIQGKGLSGDPYDLRGLVENNKSVNVMTIMNQILYPIKDMDKKYFNDVYENLFRTMAVDGKNVYLDTNKSSEYTSILKNYFGRTEYYRSIKTFITVLAELMINEFGEDTDYASLIQMGAIAY